MTYVLGADFATHYFMDSMIACHDDKKMMMMDDTNAGGFRLMANLLFGSLSISNSTSKVPWPLCGSNVNFRSGVNSFTCLPTGSRNDVGTTAYRRLWGCCWTDLICGSPLSLTDSRSIWARFSSCLGSTAIRDRYRVAQFNSCWGLIRYTYCYIYIFMNIIPANHVTPSISRFCLQVLCPQRFGRKFLLNRSFHRRHRG